MNAFADIDQLDRMGLERTDKAQRHIRPESKSRAAALADALRPLNAIRPVLSSRYLVKGWLDRGAASVVYGESNVGKTFFAMDLSLHVSAGQDWHGCKVAADTGPVVYIAGEGGSGINNRIEAIRRERRDLTVTGDFRLLSVPLDFCAPGDAAALIEVMQDLPAKPVLIVIDTLARSMGDGDENTAKDMGAFVRNIDLLRAETGAHVMVIHHSGKDTTKGARGSGSLRAAVDTEIELTRDGLVIQAETRKQRDMTCDKVFAYSLRSVFIGKDEDGDAVTSAVVEQAEPVKRKARVTGAAKVALQALDDVLARHGEKKHGDKFPGNRRCIPLSLWRDECDGRSLSSGEGDSAKRTAFMRVKTTLQDKGIIRIVDDFAWRCEE